MKTFVLGDTHGAYKGVAQVFELSSFNIEIDKLIVLGDTQDGWSEAPLIIDKFIFLESILGERFIYINGNHDLAFIEWVDNGCKRHIMNGHGGAVTTSVYLEFNEDRIIEHSEWLRRQRMSYIDNKNRFFVHAGWDSSYEFDDPGQKSKHEYAWNRSFWQGMFEGRNYAKKLTEVFVGHSPTIFFKPFQDKPINRRNVWNLDTGAAFTGRVTLMNIDSKEFWQSEKCKFLYPLERGRN